MARRRRKGRRGKSSVAMLPIMPVAIVGLQAMQASDTLAGKANYFVSRTTGYNPIAGTFSFDNAKPFLIGEVVAIVGHKVANKMGVNKSIRKLTGGWLSL